MGKREADIDGIKHFYDPSVKTRGGLGCEIYLVPCAKCGQPIRMKMYGRNRSFICDYCKLGEKKKMTEAVNSWLDSIETKAERRFSHALDEIESQVNNFGEYENAIKVARRAVEMYDSIPEAMVAVELIRLGYSIIPQQKIGKYRVDFYVPKLKLVIEVDGETFHRNNRQPNREATIQFSLGLDAKIVHVPAELIRKDIRKLSKVIEAGLKMP